MSLRISSVRDDVPGASHSHVSYGQTIDDPTPSITIAFDGPDRAPGTTIDLIAIDASGAEMRVASWTVPSDNQSSQKTLTPGADLPEGTWTFVARSQTSASESFKLTIDRTPEAAPRVLDAFDDVAPDGPNSNPPRSGWMETNDSQPTFKIDLAGTNAAAGDRIEIGHPFGTVKDSYIVTAQDVANGYAMAPMDLPDGWQDVYVRLIHADGSFVGWSASSFTLRVDTHAPSAPQIVSASDDAGLATGFAPIGGTTDDATPTFRIGYDDEHYNPPPGTSPGHSPFAQSTLARVELLANGQVVASGGLSTITAPPLPPGQYSFQARFIDTSGNVGALSQPFALTIIAPAGPPVGQAPAISGPAGGSLPNFAVNEGGLVGQQQDASVILSAADGLDDLTIGSHAVIRDGAYQGGSWTSSDGAMTVTFNGFDAASGRLDFTFQVNGGWQHAWDSETLATSFGMTITDRDGDSSQAVFGVTVRDAGPMAFADRDFVAPGASASGNVITDAAAGDAGDLDTGADRLGHDGARITAVGYGGGTIRTGSFDNGVIELTYGTLTINHDGAYSYAARPDAPLGAKDEVSYWIQDPDGDQATATLTFEIQAASGPSGPRIDLATTGLAQAEGSGGGSTPFAFTVVRSGPADAAASVDWRVDSFGGADPGDFGGAFPSGTLSFAPGETSKTITVNVVADNGFESDSRFVLFLSNPSGGALGAARGEGVILNDDRAGPEIGFTTAAAGAPEGNSGTTVLTYTVTRSGPTDAASTVEWSVWGYGHSPASADDFAGGALPSGTLTFGIGETVKTITINVAGDTRPEPAENFEILLGNATGAVVTTGRAVGAIHNDDGEPPPTSTIGFATTSLALAEGNAGSTAFSFTVQRTGDVSGSDNISWSVSFSGEHPASAADFTGATSGLLEFAPGESSKTITLNVAGDTAVEADESFTVNLGPASRAAVEPRTASGVIQDDDSSAPPSGGQVINSRGPGDTLAGGDGADTLNASRGSDVLTGGGGGDVFAWAQEPWSPATVTDFAVGSDRLDLSKVFQAAGYAGSDPVADGRIVLMGQGADTLVLFDDDGQGGDWPNYIIKLQGVSSSGLTWGQLAGQGGGGEEPPPPPPPDDEGQVINSPGPGSTLTGGAGNDTLNASQGSDVLTGGGGGDTFAWAKEPWSPATVTDFAVGSDRLDLSKVFQAAGYAGSDPVADGRIVLMGQGADTLVLFDDDGQGGDWPNYIIKLQGVSSTGLTWSQLAGQGGGGEEPPPPPPPDDEGQVINSPGPGSTLTGGAGNDTLNASQGPDQLTGAGGADHFVFPNFPWNAGRITDFTPGTDKLDLSGLLSSYSGSDPIGDRRLEFRSDGQGNTQVYVDRDAPDSGDWPFLVTTLQGVAPGQVSSGDWIF